MTTLRQATNDSRAIQAACIVNIYFLNLRTKYTTSTATEKICNVLPSRQSLGDLDLLSLMSSRLRLLLTRLIDLVRLRLREYLESLEYDIEREREREKDRVRERLERTE
jgi:hypothetical protein